MHTWYPFDIYDQAERPEVVSADGSFIYLADGRKVFDAISSWWVNIHGHRHPVLVDAAQEAMARMDQVIYAGFTHQYAEELSTHLVSHFPGMAKCFYSDDGSTAVEVGIKMAMHWHYLHGDTGRSKILALKKSYHGDTFGAMSAAGRGLFTKPYEHALFKAEYLPAPSVTDIHKSLSFEEEEILSGLQAKLEENGKEYSAFIFEPLVQGAGGMRFHTIAFLSAAIRLCRKAGLAIIADEVMTGFYRTGQRFACDYLPSDCRPDIACLSKGLTGGFLPLGATLASARIAEPLQLAKPQDRFLHGHSFTANAICCAVALASCRVLETPESASQRQALDTALAEAGQRLSAHRAYKNVRQLGGILAFELNTEGKDGYFNEVRDKAYAWFLERTILLRPLGNTLYLLPPYPTSPKVVFEAVERIIEFGQLHREL